MVSSSSTCLDLIKEYTDCVNYMCGVLKDYYSIEGNLLSARRSGKIPKEGTVDGLYSSFHGIGCFFESESDEIDVDFGPDGKVGFDLMRLIHFTRSRLNRYSVFENQDVLSNAFNKLVQDKLISKLDLEYGTHLYYVI